MSDFNIPTDYQMHSRLQTSVRYSPIQRHMISKPHALHRPPDRDQMRWLLQRFDEYRQTYQKPYHIGTREYRIRLLHWLNGYKWWCQRLQRKHGTVTVHDADNWIGAEQSDLSPDELKALQGRYYLGRGQVFDVLSD